MGRGPTWRAIFGGGGAPMLRRASAQGIGRGTYQASRPAATRCQPVGGLIAL